MRSGIAKDLFAHYYLGDGEQERISERKLCNLTPLKKDI